MLGIIYNHYLFDEPYNQKKVNAAFDKLEDFASKKGSDTFYSFTRNKRLTSFNDFLDEYVVVQHTFDLTKEEKAYIADIIKETVSLLKKYYKDELPSIVVTFTKIDEGDCFIFNK